MGEIASARKLECFQVNRKVSGFPHHEQSGDNNILKSTNNTVENFYAGKINSHYREWCALTSDTTVLSMVSEFSVDFVEMPKQTSPPRPINFNPSLIHFSRKSSFKL